MAFNKYRQQLAITPESTAKYTFRSIVGKPSVVVRHAGDGNPAYENALAKQRQARKDERGTLDEHEGRLLAARRIADACVVSWDNVVEDDGSAAPCTPDKVFEFLSMIIDTPGALDVWRDFLEFVCPAETFRAPLADAAALGKS